VRARLGASPLTHSLLTTLGLFGGTLVIAFLAGMFPLISIEVFLVGLSVYHVEPATLVILIPIAAFGHQVAKTICYFGGVAALELPRGRVKQQVDKARARIDRWNQRPNLIMVLAATIGLPPVYLIAFIAHPLMRIGFWRFTVICFVGRILRYATLAAIPLLF
jgi:membrane protein YqaA with SNARE-associated domain